MTRSDSEALGPRTRRLLLDALDLPSGERRAFLEQHLPPGEILDDALELLEEAEHLDGFLEEAPPLSARSVFAPAIPEAIGSYRIERVLGWGSMGVVYLARQASPPRPVALKVLRMDVGSPVMAQRFEREGAVLGRLSHPGIAQVYEAGLADLGAGGQPFLAMEYVDGRPITLYADEVGLERRDRVGLMELVARTVHHAHREGVLHRDLKPDNVLVRKDGTPCVLDFGVAQTTGDATEHLTLTATGQVVGTLAYMAPEQAHGVPVDARADQFALGAMLYELLTGEVPFDVRGRLPHEALRIVADGVWRPPTQHVPNLDGDLRAILSTALAPEPVRRYPDVGAFADDLGRWLAGEPVVARPPSTVETFVRIVRRHAALSAVIVVSLLALGAGLAWGTGSLLDLKREGAVSLLLSDRQVLKELEDEMEGLWPTSSGILPAMDGWLARAESLASRLPRHRAMLASLREEEAAVTAAGSELGGEWLLGEARRLVDDLAHFTGNCFLAMRARRERAGAIREETLLAPAGAWSDAATRVAADPRFDGLELVPQEGLVPLGADPASGLEELAVWNTGEIPRREDGESLRPREEDAVVLVLIPGGEASIGYDPGGLQEPVDEAPDFNDHEGPSFRVRLDPFLLAKFETTQAQWKRLFGFDPSDWEAGTEFAGKMVTPLHPVESMSWEQIMELLPRVGLTLPTEAQWEHAARGGSSWPRVYGPAQLDLAGAVSCDTRRSDRKQGFPDDGYLTHMPVGSFRPNAFGLYDVLGNVWEFCLDVYKVDYHLLEHRDGDGLVLAEPDGDVSRRGHSLYDPPRAIWLYGRQVRRFDGRDALTGLRPARRLVRENPRDGGPTPTPWND